MTHHSFWVSSTIIQLLVWQCISQTIHTLTVLRLYIKTHDFALTLDCHTIRWSNALAGISKALNPRALSFSLQPFLNWIALLMLILPVSGVLKINKILLQPALAVVSSYLKEEYRSTGPKECNCMLLSQRWSPNQLFFLPLCALDFPCATFSVISSKHFLLRLTHSQKFQQSLIKWS